MSKRPSKQPKPADDPVPVITYRVQIDFSVSAAGPLYGPDVITAIMQEWVQEWPTMADKAMLTMEQPLRIDVTEEARRE
jgi:hypothetical protein